MSNGDLFYVCGIALAVFAVLISFVGLRAKLAPLVALLFVALIGATTTFSVLHAQDEEHHDEAALHQATEEAEEVESE